MVYLLLPVHVINTIDSNLILRGKRNTLVVKPIEMEQTTQFTANIFVCECMDLMILMANENFFTNITCVFSLVLTPSFMHVYIRCSINFLSKSMLPYLLTLSVPALFLTMCPVRPEIHLCFLQNFVLSKKMPKFVFPSRFWCQSNYHPKKIKMTQKNFSYNPIFRAHFWDEKTRAELRTYMYVVGPTEVSHLWRIYTSLVLKELIGK